MAKDIKEVVKRGKRADELHGGKRRPMTPSALGAWRARNKQNAADRQYGVEYHAANDKRKKAEDEARDEHTALMRRQFGWGKK